MSSNRIKSGFLVQKSKFKLKVKLDFDLSGVCAVFGPSGSGKTTFLRSIAGFEKNIQGYLEGFGETWNDSNKNLYLKPTTRPVSMIFQDSRLFPHLNVSENLNFALKRRIGKFIEFDECVDAFLLRDVLNKYEHELSGGEIQRVALARALLRNPKLLLMDEPLSSLDEDSKFEILPFLKKIAVKFNVPFFYVTHSLDEVLYLSNTVLLMSNGNVSDVYDTASALTDFSLPFFEKEVGVLIDVTIEKIGDEGVVAAFESQTLPLKESWLGSKRRISQGDKIRLRVFARDVEVLPLENENENENENAEGLGLEAEISEIKDRGHFVFVRLKVGRTGIVSQMSKKRILKRGLKVRDRVRVAINSASILRECFGS